jgi:hypothetical protein
MRAPPVGSEGCNNAGTDFSGQGTDRLRIQKHKAQPET